MVSDGIRQNPNTHCQSHKKLNIAIRNTSGAVDQSKTGMGEDKSSNLLQVGFFFLSIHFFKNMLVNIIILILFMGI
jgi:hypothetical protein